MSTQKPSSFYLCPTFFKVLAGEDLIFPREMVLAPKFSSYGITYSFNPGREYPMTQSQMTFPEGFSRIWVGTRDDVSVPEVSQHAALLILLTNSQAPTKETQHRLSTSSMTTDRIIFVSTPDTLTYNLPQLGLFQNAL